MRQSAVFVVCLSIGVLGVAACAPSDAVVSTATAVPSATPSPAFSIDPCSAANISDTIKPINDLMRQFDNYSELASNVVQTEIVKVIPVLQAIRRNTAALVLPTCLLDLRRHALAYMDAALQTLASFVSTPDTNAIATGIAQAREAHDEYALELARLLGVTLAAPTARTPQPIPASATP